MVIFGDFQELSDLFSSYKYFPCDDHKYKNDFRFYYSGPFELYCEVYE